MIEDAYLINGVRIIVGDSISVLRSIASESVDCIVTSPPYWGLRDYGVEGQIGLEPTMQEYLQTMVGVCRELHRVLKPQGTFWLNIGDSYKAKSLCMIPNRLAILLQEDGWYVRSEIIWHKPNPMPESVKDRPTSAHEKVWLLTKSEKYFYDADAIREEFVDARKGSSGAKSLPYSDGAGRKDTLSDGVKKGLGISPRNDGRNARNVWSITPKPFKCAHFATMPPELAERCIKAGCPVGGVVLDPFGGAGTTALAAKNTGRKTVLIELNAQYAELSNNRIAAKAALGESDE